MEVKLIASTEIHWDDDSWDDGVDPHVGPYVAHFKRCECGFCDGDYADLRETPADELAEIAGRDCYRSWARPNPGTATNEGYLRNIIDQGHLSVLEHSSATFWISGVSRSLTHELVRHRHLSFSQVSQRYVDESEGGYVTHPALEEYRDQAFYEGYDPETDDYWINPKIAKLLDQHNKDSRRLYHDLVEKMVADGVDRKTARGAARGVLPNSVQTELIVSGNHRCWREVLGKRLSPAADAEIRELAQLLLRELKKIAPNTYQDFEDPK